MSVPVDGRRCARPLRRCQSTGHTASLRFHAPNARSPTDSPPQRPSPSASPTPSGRRRRSPRRVPRPPPRHCRPEGSGCSITIPPTGALGSGTVTVTDASLDTAAASFGSRSSSSSPAQRWRPRREPPTSDRSRSRGNRLGYPGHRRCLEPPGPPRWARPLPVRRRRVNRAPEFRASSTPRRSRHLAGRDV